MRCEHWNWVSSIAWSQPTHSPPRPQDWRPGSSRGRPTPTAEPRRCCRRRSAMLSMRSCGARPRALRLAPRPRILLKASGLSWKNADPSSWGNEAAMRGCRRIWWAVLIALVGAGRGRAVRGAAAGGLGGPPGGRGVGRARPAATGLGSDRRLASVTAPIAELEGWLDGAGARFADRARNRLALLSAARRPWAG